MPGQAAAFQDVAGSIAIGGDLRVRRLGFGAMRITGKGVWGDPPDRKAAVALLRHVVARGVNFIDTADSYGPAVSEELIAEALHPYPSDLVVTTKGGYRRPGPDRWEADGRPASLREACHASLKRLKLQRVDLYQLHGVDSKVPLAESIGALVDLQKEGKIRHIGVSNVSVAQLREARALARIVSVQNRYNVEDRGFDDVLDTTSADGLAFLPWRPLGAGALSGPGGTLHQVATRLGATPLQVALAWLLGRSPAMLPIPGTSSIAHFEDNLAGAALRLSDGDMAALSAAKPPR